MFFANQEEHCRILANSSISPPPALLIEVERRDSRSFTSLVEFHNTRQEKDTFVSFDHSKEREEFEVHARDPQESKMICCSHGVCPITEDGSFIQMRDRTLFETGNNKVLFATQDQSKKSFSN